jgi:serine/threonine protein kinase
MCLAFRYLGTSRDEEFLHIFLEYVPGGSIAQLLQKFGPFNERVIRSYTRQVLQVCAREKDRERSSDLDEQPSVSDGCMANMSGFLYLQGLEFLHAHKIMHRDIKGANLLVDNSGTVKLADFGASKRMEDVATIQSGHKSMKGTPYWMAPEVIKQTGHGRAADVWSVGCTVIEMATGKPPWAEFSSSISALFHIASSTGCPPLPPSLSPEAHAFLQLAFIRNPRERPTASKLLRHPFIVNNLPAHFQPAQAVRASAPVPQTVRPPGLASASLSPASSTSNPASPTPLPSAVAAAASASARRFEHAGDSLNPMQEPVWEPGRAPAYRSIIHAPGASVSTAFLRLPTAEVPVPDLSLLADPDPRLGGQRYPISSFDPQQPPAGVVRSTHPPQPVDGNTRYPTTLSPLRLSDAGYARQMSHAGAAALRSPTQQGGNGGTRSTPASPSSPTAAHAAASLPVRRPLGAETSVATSRDATSRSSAAMGPRASHTRVPSGGSPEDMRSVAGAPVDTRRAREERERDEALKSHLEEKRRAKQALWEAELQKELELQRSEAR